MKKFLAILLAAIMVIPMFAACNEGGSDKGGYKVAMITDYGDITDESFNQTTYEACKEFCEANKIDFKYYKPAGDSTPERVAQVEAAIDEGYNVIVMPGFAFAGTIYEVQDKEEYKDVKFIALDVSQFDVEDQFYNHDDNFQRTDLIDANNEPHVSKNVYCCVYQEELCGYMAGYAAVKLGYKHLGFLGGMAVPAVTRYGYGFVQGCDAAAVEMNIADQVTVEYVYGNKFFGTPEITAVMDTWYQEKKVEAVFACGGGIYASAVEAAVKVEGAKVIGVDVDQSATINKLAQGKEITVTSAMKGLAATVKDKLQTVLDGKWDTIGGKVETLGLISGDDPVANYVQIPMETTQWADGFTKDNYKELVKKMFDKTIKVDNSIEKIPATTITVNSYDNIM